MIDSNDYQPPRAPVDEAEEHAFYLENESGLRQIFADSILDAGAALTHAGWGSSRRTSDGSDSSWSNASGFTGRTASSLDESPFTDDDDSIYPIPSTSPSIEVSHSHSSFPADSSTVASEQTLTVPSNLYGHNGSHSQFPLPHGMAHFRHAEVARHHSDSNLTAPPQYPNFHRRPSDSSTILTEQFKDMHMDGRPVLSPTAPSPTPSPSEYSSPVSTGEPAFLHIPPHRIERRYSDSMGQPSHSRLLAMHYRNHSEPHLEVQATLTHERNNNFAVPPEAVGAAKNAVDVLQYNDFSGSPLATSWPLTFLPSLDTGLSSQGEATWDKGPILPVEGMSSTLYPTDPASHVDMQPYDYSNSSPVYNAQVQHSEGFPPLMDDSSSLNGFGRSDSSQPNFESLALTASQHSLNYDPRTPNPDDGQIIIAFGERPPAGYVPSSMDVDPPMPVPQVVAPTSPGAADSVASGSIPTVSSQYKPKRTRGERKPDPKALDKMRWKNKVAQFFCNLCSPARSFTIKSARDRHMRDKHSGAPPSTCELCGNPYRDQSSLQRHQRLHHGSNATAGKPRSSKKPVTCK